ncbi:alpha/beta fold hydrolase [Streptomyces graminilatus]|uniref:alpha/beta fold hydrolase n=1 Tax=Streptomyces graminilatus TaxID=1464070 RepID=UPI0006E26C4C|nr:alpha/beta fold hydrolase [Streptomyces graminilatus]
MAYVQNGGTRVWWEEHGSGEPVLLVMGHGFDSRMWHRAVAALSPRYRVLLFDNRGVGRTEWPGDSLGIPDLAADGLAVLDAAGVERAHVYGVSMGGVTAQEIALTAPERVHSLVLGCTGSLTETDQRPSPRLRTALVRYAPDWVKVRMKRNSLYAPSVDRRVVDEDMRIIASTTIVGDGLAAQSKAVATYRNRSRLGNLDVPTLVIHGDDDRTVPHAMGEDLASLIPGAAFVTLPGARHNYMDDVDCLGNRVVLDFLSAHRIEATS